MYTHWNGAKYINVLPLGGTWSDKIAVILLPTATVMLTKYLKPRSFIRIAERNELDCAEMVQIYICCLTEMRDYRQIRFT